MRQSIAIAAPRYRHTFPVAPELQYRVKSSMGLALNMMKSVAVDGTEQGYFPLPPVDPTDPNPARKRETAALWVTENDIPIPNRFGIYDWSGPFPTIGWDIFYYRTVDNAVQFMPTKMPVAGRLLKFYELLPLDNSFNQFRLPREALFQGARPLPPDPRVPGEGTPELPRYPNGVGHNPDETLYLPKNGPSGQFMGGFSCWVEVLTPAVHGLVKVAPDGQGFEYRPEGGFTGRDSFAYRIVNALGQASDAACVQIFVGV